LAEAARAGGARVILLGHTADDAAESDWMRAEGASLGRLREWGPSPAWPEGRGLMLLRPLLGATRAELRDWLAARELPWIEDPANADPRFARSRARAAGALARPGCDPPDDRACSTPVFEADARAPGVLAAGRAALCDDPAADRQLATALVCAAGSTRLPSSAAVAALLSRLRGPGPVVATLAGARMDAGHDRVLIGRDPGRRGLPRASVRAGDTVLWDGRFEITAAADGDLLSAAGLARRLPAPDRERLRLAPAWVRPTLPVLAGADGALSLPGVRSLVDERYRLSVGAIVNERDLPALSPHMARTVQSPYMDRDKVFRANVE
jgi:tRNA(Ile)-lysidine synthase